MGIAQPGDDLATDPITLEDENQRLKVELNRAAEDRRKSRAQRMRLESELLRAEGKVETLLVELKYAPRNRFEGPCYFMTRGRGEGVPGMSKFVCFCKDAGGRTVDLLTCIVRWMTSHSTRFQHADDLIQHLIPTRMSKNPLVE